MSRNRRERSGTARRRHAQADHDRHHPHHRPAPQGPQRAGQDRSTEPSAGSTASPAQASFLRQVWREWARPLLPVIIGLLSLRSSIIDWNDVPSGSMKPTILEGDRVLVNKLAYDLNFPLLNRTRGGGFTLWNGGDTITLLNWADPQRGDIVVLWSPADNRRLVKRVVAVPGDVLEVRRQRLIINGEPAAYEPLPDDYLSRAGITDPQPELHHMENVAGRRHAVMAASAAAPQADMPALTVPPRKYFLMGDHRDDSFDSRFFGFVDRRRIVGRATRVALSVDIENCDTARYRPRLFGLRDCYGIVGRTLALISLDTHTCRYPRWERFFTPLL